ncbi:MAG TPA: hypothetical protein VKB35_08315, partial [Ktedonobacteraceae bacterium]|nr:hypothetical protein [Ktedonobacteraceae bacterium]
VTIPYKEDVVPLLDEYDPVAVKIGAVNTIVNRGGRLVGYNTDAAGFIRALADFRECAFDCHGKKAVILGIGGAARAAAVALLENGVGELVLLGRTQRRVDTLVNQLRALDSSKKQVYGLPFPPLHQRWRGGQGGEARQGGEAGQQGEAGKFLSRADLLVNATPVGLSMDDESLLVDIDLLQTGAFVMDLVFNPPQTALLRAAHAHGCQVSNGLTMLLYQGALAFELWTGRAAPLEPMRAALGLITG